MNRFATIEDLETISNLRYKMFEAIGTTEQLVKDFKERTIEYYSEQYRLGRCIHVLEERDGIIVGCAGGMIRTDEFLSTSFKKSEYGYIMDVYVEPASRRKGIANNLVKMILPWFSKSNVDNIKLDASKLSGQMYDQLGFKSSIQMSLKKTDAE